MLKLESFPIAKIYVPLKRRATLKEAVVHEIAESILEVGQQVPIRVRQDGDRYVLVEGLHRLEACKVLGNETILGFLVSAQAEPQKGGSPCEAELDALRLKTECLRKLRPAKMAEERSSADSGTPWNRSMKFEDQLGYLAAAACVRLEEERSCGYSQASHWIKHKDEITGRAGMLRGDIFARAIIADALCDARDAGLVEASAVLAAECAHFIEQRQRSGIGGWVYFPGLPGLPPDADDLAQVMQVLVRCRRIADILAFVEPPLSTLLSDCRHPNGAIDTWIIPRHNRNVEQQIQAAYIAKVWGDTHDVEVIANLLYAIALYDLKRFERIVREGAIYIRDRQQTAGNWTATWYAGPFYGTFACVRLLAFVGDYEPLSRARAFLLDGQLHDGGWGNGEPSDQLSTALAICALLALAGGTVMEADVLPAARRGGEFLFATTACDDWRAPRFLHRDTRVGYASSAITAAYALKAVAAISQTLR
jgi:uncharacterized ParB-like nuclease family protein